MFRCLTLVPLKDYPCKKYVDFFDALSLKEKVQVHLTMQFESFCSFVVVCTQHCHRVVLIRAKTLFFFGVAKRASASALQLRQIATHHPICLDIGHGGLRSQLTYPWKVI